MSDLADPELRQVFESDLREDEKLLWAGRPKPGSIDSRFLFHTLFIAFWLVGALVPGGVRGPSLGTEGLYTLPLPYLIFPLIMMALALALFAHFFAVLTTPSRQLYAVTNQRIIVCSGRSKRRFNSKMKGRISAILRSGDAGTGTLKFRQGPDFGWVAILATMNAPMDKFHNIERPVEVEALIHENLFD
ncbi:hypothetical protein [Hyphobacterium sp.]|uniref:hypothetical protein n=1 Tax=Hyphobacterium sp. TaxID=2004662 RepID=UPI003748D23C